MTASPSRPPTRASSSRSPTSSISACSRSDRRCRGASWCWRWKRSAASSTSQKGTISINGHTDARPFRSDTYDNWRLSTARAHSAYYMLVRGGVDERRITEVAGFADREPKDRSRPDGGRQPPHRDPDGDRRMRRSAIIGRAVGLLLLSAGHPSAGFRRGRLAALPAGALAAAGPGPHRRRRPCRAADAGQAARNDRHAAARGGRGRFRATRRIFARCWSTA